jgi:hypothetical protein
LSAGYYVQRKQPAAARWAGFFMSSDITKQSLRRRAREGAVARRVFAAKLQAETAVLEARMESATQFMAKMVGEYQEPTRH